MREIKDLNDMYAYSLRHKSHGKKIGFVPTMGALQEGHLPPVAESQKKTDIVVVSIFVNPIQFGPSEDLASYPRDLKKDMKLLKGLEVDVLFMPEASAMFPEGFKTFVEVDGLSKKLCGRARPTHFRGVATVVAKLFNLVAPDAAFFGEKDYQQLRIIRQMAKDLNLPVEIIARPTVREFDGLAMSSRNVYLDQKERKAALIIYRALSVAKEEIEKGEKDFRKILFRLRSLIGTEPSVRIDYIAMVDPETLEDIKSLSGQVLAAVAVNLGKAKLIDNILIDAG